MIALPDDFKYPIAAVMATNLLLLWQVIRVEHFRKAAGIAYPQLYAEKEEAAKSPKVMAFNCMQRAHQNTLENVPILWSCTLISGLEYPVLSASLCAAFIVSRVFYTIGYSSGTPDKRLALGPVPMGVPIVGSSAQIALLLLAVWTAVVQFAA